MITVLHDRSSFYPGIQYEIIFLNNIYYLKDCWFFDTSDIGSENPGEKAHN